MKQSKMVEDDRLNGLILVLAFEIVAAVIVGVSPPLSTAWLLAGAELVCVGVAATAAVAEYARRALIRRLRGAA